MKHLMAALLLLAAPLATQAADNGIQIRPSPYPVADTVDRLEAVLKGKGVKVFARIDHSGEAQGAGLILRPNQLLIFGNPKAGTPLMQAVPTIGLDLPMKVLVWQDAQGQVQVAWNSADYLIQRHGLESTAAAPLSPISGLLDAALE